MGRHHRLKHIKNIRESRVHGKRARWVRKRNIRRQGVRSTAGLAHEKLMVLDMMIGEGTMRQKAPAPEEDLRPLPCSDVARDNR